LRQEQRLVCELGYLQHRAARQTVRGRERCDHVYWIKQPAFKAGRACRRQAEMNFAAVEPAKQACASLLDEMYLYTWVTAAIVHEERCKQVLDDLRRRAHPEYPGFAALQLASPLAEGLRFGQQASTALKQVLALGCQLHAATDPIEQEHAKIGLESVDLPR
jgi:hypothetical protein